MHKDKRESVTKTPSPEKSDIGLLTERAVQDRLIEAIQNQRLTDEVSDLLALPQDVLLEKSRISLRSAARALEGVAQDTRRAQNECVSQLKDQGIPATSDPISSLQFQRFSIRISPDHIGQAIKVAATMGYVIPDGLGPAALRALKYTYTDIDLMKQDSVSMRLTLAWGLTRSPAIRRLKRVFSPRFADFASLAPPEFLWPVFFATKPARVVAQTLGFWRASGNTANYDPGVNLGTPESLISPLLKIMEITEQDTLLDFGCGDGRIVIAAALNTQCRAIGIECDIRLCQIAKTAVQNAGVIDHVTILNDEATDDVVAKADTIFLFQPMSTLRSLLKLIRPKMRRGTQIVVHEQSPLAPDLKPDLSVPIFAANAITVAHIWRG